MVSSLLNVGMMLVLAFVLAISSIFCLVIVRRANEKNVRIELVPDSARIFKGDHFSVSSSMSLASQNWVSLRLSSIQSPLGTQAKTEVKEKNTIEITISPLYAGRHKGMEIVVEASDPLDLFEKKIKMNYEEYTVDALPQSLLELIPRTRPRSVRSGESPAGFSGTSVELYSLDEYRPFGETKDILWKKVARMTDESLIIRTRGSNSPRLIRIALVLGAERDKTEDAKTFMDEACEALGRLGNNLLSLGCSLEIVKWTMGPKPRLLVENATGIDELSKALMSLWEDEENLDNVDQNMVSRLLLESDIIATGFKEAQDRAFASLASKKFVLLIRERTSFPTFANEKTTISSDWEGIGRLAMRVVEK